MRLKRRGVAVFCQASSLRCSFPSGYWLPDREGFPPRTDCRQHGCGTSATELMPAEGSPYGNGRRHPASARGSSGIIEQVIPSITVLVGAEVNVVDRYRRRSVVEPFHCIDSSRCPQPKPGRPDTHHPNCRIVQRTRAVQDLIQAVGCRDAASSRHLNTEGRRELGGIL